MTSFYSPNVFYLQPETLKKRRKNVLVINKIEVFLGLNGDLKGKMT